MSSTLNPTRSDFMDDSWPAKPPVQTRVNWAGAKSRPSLGKRALRSLIIFCIGVTATLGWQSYGDTARAMIAQSYPQLRWLAPQDEALAQTAPNMVARNAPAAPSAEAQQFASSVSLALAALRQSVEQLAAEQQRMAGDIAKLQVAEHDILAKISAPPPKPAPAPAPARKPQPVTLPQASAER